MFNCFPNADAWAQARVGPGLAMPLFSSTTMLKYEDVSKINMEVQRVWAQTIQIDTTFKIPVKRRLFLNQDHTVFGVQCIHCQLKEGCFSTRIIPYLVFSAFTAS